MTGQMHLDATYSSNFKNYNSCYIDYIDQSLTVSPNITIIQKFRH